MIYVNDRTVFMVVTLSIAILLVCIFYRYYVQIIKNRNIVKEAMAGIDVQLQKRYDLIPNILTIANKFMEHEKALLTDITELRAKVLNLGSGKDTMSEKIKLDNAISDKMGQLFVSVENYPQLKSDATMMQAMQTYSEVEEHIAAARRFYNAGVNELNNSVEIFPSSIIASMLGVFSYPYFEAISEAKNGVKASDYFNK